MIPTRSLLSCPESQYNYSIEIPTQTSDKKLLIKQSIDGLKISVKTGDNQVIKIQKNLIEGLPKDFVPKEFFDSCYARLATVGSEDKAYISQSVKGGMKKSEEDDVNPMMQIDNPSELAQVNTLQLEVKSTLQFSEEAFFKAIDLMFDKGSLQDRLSINNDTFGNHYVPQPSYPFSLDQKKIRYRQLKEEIAKILPEHINCTFNYREKMHSPVTSLLQQAIMNIKDSAHRLEIVNLLLQKGANPTIPGDVCEHTYNCECKDKINRLSIDPIEAARRTGDQQLMNVLRQAINQEDVLMPGKKFAINFIIEPLHLKELSAKEEKSRECHKKFIELMSTLDCELEDLNQVFHKFCLEERYNILKETIQGILSQDIDTYNVTCYDRILIPIFVGKKDAYKEFYIEFHKTPLLEAIVKIADPLKRREIVKMLLDKGANPRVMSLCQFHPWNSKYSLESQLFGNQFIEINPLTMAQKIGDHELVDLLNQAIQKLDEI